VAHVIKAAREEIMKILLAVDDSEFSDAATQKVIAQTRPRDTEVRVLHVMEPVFVTGELAVYIPDISSVKAERVKRAEELIGRTAQALRAAGLKVSTALEEGDPKSKIIDLAEAWHADLIVVGSHGRKGLNRFFLGSVSEAVARHARCSVEIVRLLERAA